MIKKRYIGNLLLLIAAIIWGSAFVAQREGMDFIGPFTFQAVRSFLGSAFLLPIIFSLDKLKKKNGSFRKANTKSLIIGGILCGTALTVAACFQQVGIMYTTVGKAGFLTALYVIMVPIVSIFFKKKVSPVIWGCVGLAVVGLYLLCMTESLKLSLGDTLVLICALCFTAHIMIIDHFILKVDGVKLACLQFFVSGILSSVLMFVFEKPDINAILNAWFPLVYTGILSSGVAYTLQIVGQKYTQPTMASLIMSLESVFAVLTGMIIPPFEIPSLRETFGCIIMFTAIVLAQVPLPKRKK